MFALLNYKDGAMFEKIKEKMHIIFIVVMIIYLAALAIKTGHTFWEEHQKQKTSEQTTGPKAGD